MAEEEEEEEEEEDDEEEDDEEEDEDARPLWVFFLFNGTWTDDLASRFLFSTCLRYFLYSETGPYCCSQSALIDSCSR